MSQAYADGSEPPLPNGAKERAYIDQMANEAGLSSSEFVATTIGGLVTRTGMVLTSNPGMQLLNVTLGENLDNLISAADYPDWDTLSETEQSAYGSKINYDSTKYVSLMEAFDLDDGYSRFAETGSSGGAFTFTDEESSRLQRIGNIGKNWSNRIGQTMQSVKDCLAPDYDEILYRWMYGNNTSSEGEQLYNGTFPDDWSEGEYVYYNQTNVGWVKYGTDGRNVVKVQSLGDVYLIMRKTSEGNILSSFNLFSVAPFRCGTGSSIEGDVNLNVSSKTYNSSSGHVFYYIDSNYSLRNIYQSSQAISLFSRDTNETKLRFIEEQILFGDPGGGGSAPGELVPDIPSYPTEQVPDTTVVYYPIGGITPETTWNQYTDVQRPENPFNPDDQTSTPEWQQETKQNVQGLQGIHFDRLFPFSMVYSIPNLVNVVRHGVATDSQAKNVVIVPFRWSDTYVDDLRLDLSDLVSLLIMVRPFNRVLLVFALLMALVLFWKSILTGD